MSLYPEGHSHFRSHGLCVDELTAERLQAIADEGSLKTCLHGAACDLGFSRFYVETLRARLFHAEQLIHTQPLPAKNLWILLPHELPAMLETIKAAQQCVEEWLESETCKRILEKYPERPRHR